MELRPYYDRPISTIDAYVTEILGAVAANFRHWGEYKYVWPKQGYGKGVLRADQFSLLGTFGQWLVPSSGSSGNPNSVTVDSYGWAQRVLDFKTLEEFYYLIMEFSTLFLLYSSQSTNGASQVWKRLSLTNSSSKCWKNHSFGTKCQSLSSQRRPSSVLTASSVDLQTTVTLPSLVLRSGVSSVQ